MIIVGNLHSSNSKEANLAFLEQSCHYSMVASKLYQTRKNLIMRLCIDKEEEATYIEHAHIAIGKMHLSPKQTLRRIGRMGVYWPTMNQDIHRYIKECTFIRGENPIDLNCITLYKMSPIAPKWEKALVEHMSTNVIQIKMSKVSQRYLQKHTQDYYIIANQLYHRSKDESLRICVMEEK